MTKSLLDHNYFVEEAKMAMRRNMYRTERDPVVRSWNNGLQRAIEILEVLEQSAEIERLAKGISSAND